MNILIVSENFLNGGLETQINTTVNALKNDNEFFFALRAYNPNWNLKNVFTDFNFSYNSTIYQFCDDVNNLIKIIKENNIEIIHVHPFYSLFPAVFAAKICNKPIVYTYHGISSYSFSSRINDNILYNMFLDYEIDKIFCVSMEGKHITENIVLNKEKTIYLPNSIDTKIFSKVNVQNNKHWALISRLDIDKIEELKTIINIIESIDIKELHIYGNGNQEETIKKYALDKNLTDRVIFEGYNENLSTELKDKYNGIIGIGRSAMEAISMNYPVILLGYNKISGIIDDKKYSYLKTENFSNKSLPSISIEELNLELQKVYNNSYSKNFYDTFTNEFSSKNIANQYSNELQKTFSSSTLNIKNLFEELNNLNLEESFYDSNDVYTLFVKFFAHFCRLSAQKNLFIIKNNLLNLNTNINNYLTDYRTKMSEQANQIIEIKEKILHQDQIIENINNNTMTLNNLKRKI